MTRPTLAESRMLQAVAELAAVGRTPTLRTLAQYVFASPHQAGHVQRTLGGLAARYLVRRTRAPRGWALTPRGREALRAGYTAGGDPPTAAWRESSGDGVPPGAAGGGSTPPRSREGRRAHA